MTRSMKAFLWCLPAALILIHDVFFYFGAGDGEYFSTLEWLMQTYLPGLHEGMMQSVGEEYYGNFLKPLFEMKAVYFFGAIAGIAILWQICVGKLEEELPPPQVDRPKFRSGR